MKFPVPVLFIKTCNYKSSMPNIPMIYKEKKKKKKEEKKTGPKSRHWRYTAKYNESFLLMLLSMTKISHLARRL